MATLGGFFKTKKYRKTSDGYKLQSEWTSSETVQYNNGLTLEESEVYLTQAEYNALGDEKYTNNVKYYITDAASTGGNIEAEYVTYDNTESGLTATNVNTAIDELNSNLEWTTIDINQIFTTTDSTYGTDFGTYPELINCKELVIRHAGEQSFLINDGSDDVRIHRWRYIRYSSADNVDYRSESRIKIDFTTGKITGDQTVKGKQTVYHTLEWIKYR